jgi:hypothetical protein
MRHINRDAWISDLLVKLGFPVTAEHFACAVRGDPTKCGLFYALMAVPGVVFVVVHKTIVTVHYANNRTIRYAHSYSQDVDVFDETGEYPRIGQRHFLKVPPSKEGERERSARPSQIASMGNAPQR